MNNKLSQLAVEVHTFNISVSEAEAVALWVPGQPELYSSTTIIVYYLSLIIHRECEGIFRSPAAAKSHRCSGLTSGIVSAGELLDCNPSTWEVKTEGSEIQSQPWLYASLYSAWAIWDHVFLKMKNKCNLDWPQTLNPPASTSPTLGLQACIITSPPPNTHTLSVISGWLIMPEATQTDVIVGCSGEMPQGIMWLVQNKKKPFSSNTVIPLLFECIHSDCSDSRADYMAFKDVYPQRVGAGRWN